MSEQKILVTGATGQIGNYVATMLKEKGVQFVAGVSSKEKFIDGMECVVFNYTDHQGMVKSLDGIHKMFLVAPFVPQMKQWTLNALGAAQEAGVKYLVRSSGIGADPDSDAEMAKIQGQIDQAIMESGLSYAIICPMTFMQNFTTYHAQSIKEQGAIYQPQGEGKSSFVHVKDVAAVAVEVLLDQEKYQRQIFNITGGEALSNADVATIISETIGKKIQYVDVAEEAAEKAMKELGMPQVIIEQLMSLNRITKAGYAEVITSTVADVTSHEPITFKEFAKDNASIWR